MMPALRATIVAPGRSATKLAAMTLGRRRVAMAPPLAASRRFASRGDS
jgi:hypothetical protein